MYFCFVDCQDAFRFERQRCYDRAGTKETKAFHISVDDCPPMVATWWMIIISLMGDLIITALESSVRDKIIEATSASGKGSAEVSMNRLATSVWMELRT